VCFHDGLLHFPLFFSKAVSAPPPPPNPITALTPPTLSSQTILIPPYSISAPTVSLHSFCFSSGARFFPLCIADVLSPPPVYSLLFGPRHQTPFFLPQTVTSHYSDRIPPRSHTHFSRSFPLLTKVGGESRRGSAT